MTDVYVYLCTNNLEYYYCDYYCLFYLYYYICKTVPNQIITNSSTSITIIFVVVPYIMIMIITIT